jgi:AraC-like DNA-binding protein
VPPASSYRELPPPPALAPFVACLWVQRIAPGGGPYAQPVHPDGCVDLVVQDGAPRVVGPATRTATAVRAPGSTTGGVRFRVGAAAPLLRAAPPELRDAQVPVEDLWGRGGRDLAARCDDSGADETALFDALVRGLVGRLDAVDGPDALVLHAVHRLEGTTPLGALAEEVGLSERQLRRRVEAAVGLGPRVLGRVLRFQRFLDAARASAAPDLAALAAQAGYSDQAHLTHESRALAGLPPGELLAQEAQRLEG